MIPLREEVDGGIVEITRKRRERSNARGRGRIAALRALAILALAPLLATVAGCTPAIPVVPKVDPAAALAGDVASIEPLATYPHLVLRALFWWQGFADAIPTEHGISLYRIGYWTRDPAGRLVLASGLVAFPRSDGPMRGVVSWQHGTATNRDAAPSTPDPYNGVLAAAVFAGHGYVLVAPDYLGFGLSTELHPYYHAASIASSVADLLQASRRVVAASGREWPSALFLTGFSQGGHATLAAQRALEAAALEGLSVRAAAPVAGPVDLARIGFPNALAGRSRFASLYLAWIAASYARVYGMPSESVLQEPYARTAPTLFDGSHDGDTVVATLPRSPRELLAPELLRAFESGEDHWFLARLGENGVLDWTPRAPIRAYYGEADVDVSPEEAHRLEEHMRARGADVEAVSVGALDHEASILAAVPRIRDWFDALAAERAPPP